MRHRRNLYKIHMGIWKRSSWKYKKRRQNKTETGLTRQIVWIREEFGRI